MSWLDDEHLRVLFQGDSITDGGRSRNEDLNHVMGHGYAYLIAGRLGADYPLRDYHFLNRGVSGNCVPDVLARIEPDIIDLKPDILSILLGVNDVGSVINGRRDATPEDFERDYRMLLEKVRSELPGTRFVLCDPFILPVRSVKENWSRWVEGISAIQHIVGKLADGYDAVHVKLQPVFDKAAGRREPGYWLWDGVHPTPAGHELIARKWIEAVFS